jgi:hypothetical protein
MTDIKDFILQLEDTTLSLEEQQAALLMIEQTLIENKQIQEKTLEESSNLIVDAVRTVEEKLDAKFTALKTDPKLKGPKGDQGIRGENGKSGRDGVNGKDGINGHDGVDGIDGNDGRYVVNVEVDLDDTLLVTLSDGTQIKTTKEIKGTKGDQGPQGLRGSNGNGVVVGGSTGQVLTKVSNTDYDTAWTTVSSGSGTVTSVTGTSPVVSSGGTTPAISMPAATTSVDGYLTSADWNTFNGKGAGTVTSVAATVPSVLSITGSPITTGGTLAIGYSGTALPIANGGTGATTVAEAFSDLTPLTLTTASASALVLTNTSGYQQQIIGSANQTITLPSTATLAVGWSFLITNGTGGYTVTVNTSTGANVYANSNIGSYRVWCISTANNNAASWSFGADLFSSETGTGSVVRALSPTFSSIAATGNLNLGGSAGQSALFATNQTTANTIICTAQTSGQLTIGNTGGTGTQTIGCSTVSQTTNIQAGATASGSTKAMNIGTGGLAGSTTNIAIGSTAGTSTTTLNGALSLQNALPVLQGGTGVTTSTGTGANVQASLPSFLTTIGVGGATASASGAGISFPATQSASTDANTLDDYEEGSFTATVGAGGITSQSCRYTKIGRSVSITGTIIYSGASVDPSFGGLPFTSANTHDVGIAVYAQNMESSAGGPIIGIIIQNSASTAFYSWVNNSLGNAYQSSGTLSFSCTYFV